jgi:histidinol-phosphate aminotransferase
MLRVPFRQHLPGLPAIETGAGMTARLAQRGQADLVRLNSNEGALPPFPEAIAAMSAVAAGLNRYPHPTARPVAEAVAKLHGLTPEHILVGAGSTSLIYLLAAAVMEADDELLVPWPSFPQYKNAALFQRGRVVAVPLADYALDVDAMLAAVTPRTRIAIIGNPNNPTGTIVDRAELDRFLGALPERVLAVVDEAYAEYAPDLVDGLAHVRAAKRPVVVLRTFSKIYGLAGARVGYGVAEPSVVATLMLFQPPFAVHQLAIAAAVASVQRQDLVAERARATAEEREYICAGLRTLGLRWVPSVANFVFVDVGRDAAPVFAKLVEGGVLVRPGAGYDEPRHLRVTVGRREENTAFLEALGRSI